MMRKFIFFSLLFTTMFAASSAWADCAYNGKTYPVGTVIDGKICTPQGWRNL